MLYRCLLTILLAALAVPAAAQTEVFQKVQVRSTAADALIVFGGGTFGATSDPSAQVLDVRSSGDDLSSGMRISRADGSYFILNMDDGGSTAWATLQAGDGGTYRPIKLNPNGGQVLLPNGSLGSPALSFANDTTSGLERYSTTGFYMQANGVRIASVQSDRFNIESNALGVGTKGPFLFIGRNSSGTGAPGSLAWDDKNNTAWVTWFDTSGNMRVSSAAPIEGGSDTTGTVIGTQTSSRASKHILGRVNVWAPSAMELIRQTPVYAFTYKNGAFNGETFYGIVTDDSPLFGMDRGQSFNPVSAFGATVLALQDLDARMRALEARR